MDKTSQGDKSLIGAAAAQRFEELICARTVSKDWLDSAGKPDHEAAEAAVRKADPELAKERDKYVRTKFEKTIFSQRRVK